MIYSFSEILLRKTARLHWPLLALVTLMTATGLILLYDAAGGSVMPYAGKQAVRFMAGLGLAWALAVTDIRTVYRAAYPAFFLCLVLLVLVPFIGQTGMGAKRWISLGFFNLQPSEVMKLALVVVLARFFHSRSLRAIHSLTGFAFLGFLVGVPALLTLKQPDLGTAISLVAVAVGVMFLAGVSWKVFFSGFVAAAAATPLMWMFVLKEYQKNRVLTFLNPESDPLGTGYHVIQSKIAIGSAGFGGKGFMQGTQAHLQFLPEKHTDFIFTLLTEDFGLAGAGLLIGAFMLFIGIGMWVATRAHNTFASLVAGGVVVMVFFHALVNMAMVMGLMPVVGVPLPFVSYGGTSLLTMMMGVGLLLNAHVHRDVLLPGEPGMIER